MTGDRIHPELRRRARFLPRQPVSPRTLPIIRRLHNATGDGRDRDIEIVELDNNVQVRVHRPAQTTDPTPALLWIHGGGYVIGRAQQDDALCRRFADTLGIVVAAVDYRLAPEHPYPQPLHDCFDALRWLADRREVDSTRLAIGGASAGGGLAAALALHTRDHGPVVPALQLLLYPMLDDRTVPRPEVADHYRLWSDRSNRWAWDCYLRDADRELAVPARRQDLSGVAPAWIGVGTCDLFHDESLDYAERLRDAGVDCSLEVVPGAFHAFDLVAPKAPISQAFFSSQSARLSAALGTAVR